MVLQQETARPGLGLGRRGRGGDRAVPRPARDHHRRSNGRWRVRLPTHEGRRQAGGVRGPRQEHRPPLATCWSAKSGSAAASRTWNGRSPARSSRRPTSPPPRTPTSACSPSPSSRPIEPVDDVKAAWLECGPETVRGFLRRGATTSAASCSGPADVPVGLIHTSWGGSPAEVWMRQDRADARPRIPPRHPGHLPEPPSRATSETLAAVGEGEGRRPRRQGRSSETRPPLGNLAPGRALQRHDRPAHPLRHQRRHLVPGRIQRRPRLAVPHGCFPT